MLANISRKSINSRNINPFEIVERFNDIRIFTVVIETIGQLLKQMTDIGKSECLSLKASWWSVALAR